MDVVSQGPLRTASLLWLPRAGQWTLTVVCKATFDLRPGECTLAAEQDAVNEEDNHWNDDPTRSVYSPADLVPYKPRADVLLVGSAFAPHGQPVPSLIARLAVGTVNKAVEVHGDRSFAPDGQVRERTPFAKMALRYERTAGGADTWNPVGVRLATSVVLPNLLPPGSSIARRGDFVAPIGFGPLAPSWPERRTRLGKYDGIWPQPGWNERPYPKEIDAGYYNVAPRDQQVDALRDDERIVLENLHPEHPRLATKLPNLRPKAVVERRNAPPAEIRMTADTLWIDTDRGVCTVTWRTHVQLADRTEWGRILIGAGAADHAAPASTHDTAVLGNVMAAISGGGAVAAVRGGATTTAEIEEVSVDEELTGSHADRVDGAVQTMFLTPSAAPAKAVLPFAAAPAPAAVAPAPAPAPPIEPPSLVPPAAAQEPIASSPWAAPAAEARPRLSIGEQAAIPPQQPVRPPATSGGGVLDASNAAVGAAAAPAIAEAPAPAPAVEARPRARPREVIKLLWFDPRSVARIRKHPEWRVILAELELRLLEEGDLDEEEAADAPPDEPKPKDRRDVFEVLAKGRPIGAEGVKVALDEAIGEDGKFDPPLVLLAGELEFPFDEVATLKATAAAAAPFALGDPKLKEQLDVVEELQKTPWLQGSGSIAEGLTEKIKAAFAAQKRGVGPEYLTSHTERMLLEQRCYQMRTVFGKRWIRSVLGASGVPVYVPEALKDELPMYRRVKVKLVGEVDMQEDQFEGGGAAVKVAALGRVMG
jgi:hypothetical protein